jgi:UDP-glucose 4-epimerase
MRVLVTGGAGFIGSNLVRYLEAQGIDVAVVDNFSRGRLTNLDDTAANKHHAIGSGDVSEFVEEDVCDVDAVVHAACVSITAAVMDPVGAFRTNTLGTAAVADACEEAGIPLIYLSSASVYDVNCGAQPWRETDIDPFAPRGPYAQSKLAGELAVRSIFPPATILRLSNVYGPWQHHDDPHTGVVAKFLGAAFKRESLPIISNGTQTRDFTYVGDVCAAIHKTLLTRSAASTTLNIGTGRETSIEELADRVDTAVGSSGRRRIWQLERRPTDDVYRRAVSINYAARVLDWRATTTLQEGLERTAAWWRERNDVAAV